MKKSILVFVLVISSLTACNNEPFGMAVNLHPQTPQSDQLQQVILTNRVDLSLPNSTAVLKAGNLQTSVAENGYYSQSCLSVAACD